MVRPSALAVRRLMTSSNRVGCYRRSAGWHPSGSSRRKCRAGGHSHGRSIADQTTGPGELAPTADAGTAWRDPTATRYATRPLKNGSPSTTSAPALPIDKLKFTMRFCANNYPVYLTSLVGVARMRPADSCVYVSHLAGSSRTRPSSRCSFARAAAGAPGSPAEKERTPPLIIPCKQQQKQRGALSGGPNSLSAH